MWPVAAKTISIIQRKINPSRFFNGSAGRVIELLLPIRAADSFPALFSDHAGNCDMAAEKIHIGG
jgi:hypothetical protein